MHRTRLAGAPLLLSAVSAAVVLGLQGQADAAFVVNLDQVGGNVVATGSGSINLSGLTLFASGGDALSALQPEYGVAMSGVTNSAADQYQPSSVAGPSNFGTGFYDLSSSGSGDFVGINNVYKPDESFVYVPAGYSSGNPLSDEATYDSSTLASLGVTPGTYTWTWGSGATADSFTLIAAVPEPGAIGLVGFAALGLLRRRKA